jgi:hypothetical protein
LKTSKGDKEQFWQYYWLSALAAIIFLMALVAVETVPQPNSHGYQAASEEAQQGCEDKPFWQRTACDPVAFFTFVLAAFTGILAVATVFLWLATQKILAESSRTTRKQLRAYVYISDAMIIRRPGDQIQATVAFKNFGQTPAKSVSYAFDKIWFGVSDESEMSFGGNGHLHEYRTIDDIAPGHERVLTSPYEPYRNPIPEEVARRQRAIYFWGTLKYEDVFGQEQTLKFRRAAVSVPGMITEGEVYRVKRSTAGHLILCRGGNSST